MVHEEESGSRKAAAFQIVQRSVLLNGRSGGSDDFDLQVLSCCVKNKNKMVDRFQIGVITKPHGLRGEVKVFPTTDEPERFLDLEEVILDTGREEKRLKIRSVKFFKNFVILGFEGVDRVEDVERLSRASLQIERDQALPLGEREFFIPDLIGLTVINEEGEKVGILEDVMQTGANDVYIAKTPDGKELLLPAISDCVKEVSLEKGTMTVHVLPGLMDL